jgi:starch phosphorylase
MPEAQEQWYVPLFKSVIPQTYKYIVLLQKALLKELAAAGITLAKDQKPYLIIDNNTINMARLAIFASHSTNGVAKIHTEILKKDTLKDWYRLYPERFTARQTESRREGGLESQTGSLPVS